MKKSIFIIAAGFAVLAFSSCQKDYTCQCKVNSNGIVYSTSTIHSTKSKASDACTASGTTGYTTCTIQ